jgi:endonuclease-3 related protein
MQKKNKIQKLYSRLLKNYGPQGWWPIGGLYHKGDYSYPKTENEKFEICAGAVLTQNTSWTNVEKALYNLQKEQVLTPDAVISSLDETLKKLIRPAGYYNQKTVYLKALSEFFKTLDGGIPSREQLLACRGIGNETADSMLLYAFNQPQFVVDTYTRRILSHFDLCTPDEKYMNIKTLFEESLPADVVVYQEYHALLVEFAKRHFQKRPYCSNIEPGFPF